MKSLILSMILSTAVLITCIHGETLEDNEDLSALLLEEEPKDSDTELQNDLTDVDDEESFLSKEEFNRNIGCKQPCLYFSNTKNIYSMPANFSKQPVPVLTKLSRAVALDVHVSRGLIFWSDVNKKTIQRASLDGTNRTVIAKVGVCDGLAVEWTTDLLYWTDTTHNTIEIARLNGSRRKVLISKNLDQPRGIALDPSSGLMFWTDWGRNPKIERSTLNGEDRRTLVSSSLGWPNDIVVDQSSRTIYWADAKTDVIEKSDYSGFGRVKVFSRNGIHPFALGLYRYLLYWTDWRFGSGLHQLNTTSGIIKSPLISTGGTKMGLAVYDNSKQIPVPNGCQNNNGGCSFLCLRKQNGIMCACPKGKVLGSDGKTCQNPGVTPPPRNTTTTPPETTTARPITTTVRPITTTARPITTARRTTTERHQPNKDLLRVLLKLLDIFKKMLDMMSRLLEFHMKRQLAEYHKRELVSMMRGIDEEATLFKESRDPEVIRAMDDVRNTRMRAMVILSKLNEYTGDDSDSDMPDVDV